MFNFTALLGARSSSPASQSLIELDGGVKILIDVGWDDTFDVTKLRALEEHVPTISAILLTHATKEHIGAFAHCCKHFPRFTRIPIYATTPVISLGRALLQDLYACTPLASSIIPLSSLSESAYSLSSEDAAKDPHILFQPPTAEDIAAYFALIHPLKFSQPHQPLSSPLSSPLHGLTVTAYSAGHTIGGTIWHIQHGLESIVYAVDWNQARENILSGAAWLGGTVAGGTEVIEQLRRPTALICSARGAERSALPGGLKKRDDALLDLIRNAVSNGSTVLIPCDSSARILELAYLLERAWRLDHESGISGTGLKECKLYLATRGSNTTMRYVRSMLEWMDQDIAKEFEDAGAAQAHQNTQRRGPNGPPKPNQPFDFKYMELLERRSQVNRALSSKLSKVILASDTSLEWGFSRDVFKHIANDPRNVIVLPEHVRDTGPDSTPARKGLGRSVYEYWLEQQQKGAEEHSAQAYETKGHAFEIVETQVEPLTRDELPLYQRFQARQRQLHSTINPNGSTILETSADAVDEQSSTASSSSEESDTEQQGKSMNITAALAHNKNKLGLSEAEMGVNVLIRGKNVHDFDVRGKKGRDRTFPFVTKRRRIDDFGELIRPEDYLRAEEREEVDAENLPAASKDQSLGQKRRWVDMEKSRKANGPVVNGMRKRARAKPGNQVQTQNGQNTVDGAARDVVEGSESEGTDDEAKDPQLEGPKKVVFKNETIRANLKIAFVDFSGLHDKRSLQLMIPLIRPRKLILTGGEERETLSLADDCRASLAAGSTEPEGTTVDVFTPVVGLTVDASVDTNAWFVRLSQPLVKRLQWQNVKGLGVVTIHGSLKAAEVQDEPSDNSNKKHKAIKNEAALKESDNRAYVTPEQPPMLDVVPASMAAATRSVAQPLHVGDMRLTDLRRMLLASGHSAEFRGEGTLLIDGLVAVRKSGTGKIEVEGSGSSSVQGRNTRRSAESTFFAVKRVIYQGLAVVAGA